MRPSQVAARLLSSRLGQVAKQPVRHAVERLGYDMVPLERDATSRFSQRLRTSGCASLVDVGANQGQYAERARMLGFAGTILSLEPGTDSFALLQRRAAADPRWLVRQVAAGRSPGSSVLNVSRNSVSSSLLEVTGTHVAAAPESVTNRQEQVQVLPLDELTAELDGPLWLKLDTQGFEAEVLAGAARTLDRTVVAQVELSLVPLYGGQATYLEVLDLLDRNGFDVVDLEQGLRSSDGSQLLQCDAVLTRRSGPPS